MRILISILTLMLCSTSCEKAFMGCDISVDTSVQATSDATIETVNRMLGYVFYADTLSYTVESYENAQNGYITNIISKEKLGYNETAIYNNTTRTLEFKNTNRPQCIILVVDPDSKTFAYKQQDVVENLSEIYLKLTFKLWKFDEYTSFYENKWHFGK